MKKIYVIPATRIVNVEPVRILAGTTTNNNNILNEDGTELYLDICADGDGNIDEAV